MSLIITDYAVLKEHWLRHASELHEARGCGTVKNGSVWACADSKVGCAATAFSRLKREGQPVDQMIAWDKLQNGIEP